jgi:hypothetical protein
MVNIIHEVTAAYGNCGWVIENVDASDHRNDLVQEEYNQVVKGILGRGYAFDAVAVGSYTHRFPPLFFTIWWNKNLRLVLRINLCRIS